MPKQVKKQPLLELELSTSPLQLNLETPIWVSFLLALGYPSAVKTPSGSMGFSRPLGL